MKRSDIAKILKRWPTLNAGGIGLTAPFVYLSREEFSDRQRAEMITNLRIDLLESAEVCTAVVEWLSLLTPTAAANVGSYGLKEHAENALFCYVSNGAAIVAAIHAGLSVRHRGGPDLDIGVAERSLRPWSIPLRLTEMGAKPRPLAMNTLLPRKLTGASTAFIAPSASCCASCATR